MLRRRSKLSKRGLVGGRNCCRTKTDLPPTKSARWHWFTLHDEQKHCSKSSSTLSDRGANTLNTSQSPGKMKKHRRGLGEDSLRLPIAQEEPASEPRGTKNTSSFVARETSRNVRTINFAVRNIQICAGICALTTRYFP